MIIPPVSRNIIDHWEVNGAGLPVRLVNCSPALRIRYVGALRALLAKEGADIPGMGPATLQAIDDFFSLCAELERGLVRFHCFKDLLHYFLTIDEFDILAERYGLLHADADPTGRYATLQALANIRGVSRERIRYIEQTAKQKLGSKLARCCLHPIYNDIQQTIIGDRHIIHHSVARQRDVEGLLQGVNAAATLHFLSLLQPESFTSWKGCFSRYTPKLLQEAETTVTAYLLRQDRPVTAQSILQKAGKRERAAALPSGFEHLLDTLPGIFKTTGGLYLLSERSLEHFLYEVALSEGVPLHYRALAEAANRELIPPHRRGQRFYLEKLNQYSCFSRVTFGVYELATPVSCTTPKP